LLTGNHLESLEAIARELAQTLNCSQPPGRFASGHPIAPCRECPRCSLIQADNHPDVQWLRPESKLRVITIDQTRELMQTVHLKPLDAEHKVAVIVAADRMNPQAANAFLKTLEEPPEKSLLLLLSTEPERVMKTILSRCLRLSCADTQEAAFRPTARDFVRVFAEKLATGAGPGLLGRYQLLTLLMQFLAEARTAADKELSGRSPLDQYEDVEPQLREKWEEERAAAIEADYRYRRSELVAALQCWFRDVWLRCASHAPSLCFFPDLAPQTDALARGLSVSEAWENIQTFERTHYLLQTNVQEALTLEVCLLKLRLGSLTAASTHAGPARKPAGKLDA
jgi:DNA polymerase-3 subunit delta'